MAPCADYETWSTSDTATDNPCPRPGKAACLPFAGTDLAEAKANARRPWMAASAESIARAWRNCCPGWAIRPLCSAIACSTYRPGHWARNQKTAARNPPLAKPFDLESLGV